MQRQIEWHVKKILLMQDSVGMIPSSVEFFNRELKKQKDIPRQSMATMALTFAQALYPELGIYSQIQKSSEYVEGTFESEEESNQHYILLYVALAQVYAKKDPKEYVEKIVSHFSPIFFRHPVAVNLYLRLSSLLEEPLPHQAYILETQRYNLSLTPRRHRYFDYADTLVWGERYDTQLAQREYKYLLSHKVQDHWFRDTNLNARSTASVVGKMFEVFSFYTKDLGLVELIYRALMSQKASSQYAKDILGEYGEHILSEPNTLRIDDTHTHILMGLCYLYQKAFYVV